MAWLNVYIKDFLKSHVFNFALVDDKYLHLPFFLANFKLFRKIARCIKIVITVCRIVSLLGESFRLQQRHIKRYQEKSLPN